MIHVSQPGIGKCDELWPVDHSKTFAFHGQSWKRGYRYYMFPVQQKKKTLRTYASPEYYRDKISSVQKITINIDIICSKPIFMYSLLLYTNRNHTFFINKIIGTRLEYAVTLTRSLLWERNKDWNNYSVISIISV